MKLAIFSISILLLTSTTITVNASSEINPSAGNTPNSNTMKLSIKSPWTSTTIKLVTPVSPGASKGKPLEVVAKLASYQAAGIPSPFWVLAITDPYTKRNCIVQTVPAGSRTDDMGLFYLSGSSGVIAYSAGPGALIWTDSYVSMPSAAGGLDATIARFEAEYNGKRLLQIDIDSASNNRIMLKEATPLFFFSDAPAPGGLMVGPTIESVDLTDSILTLALRNPKTKKPATFWIDLTAKKITKSVVDGQEMDMNSGKPYGVPLKKP